MATLLECEMCGAELTKKPGRGRNPHRCSGCNRVHNRVYMRIAKRRERKRTDANR